jgi:hypothetical protein
VDEHEPGLHRQPGRGRRSPGLVRRYTGTITAPATGDYRFSLSGGGIVRVWIDGTPVVSYARSTSRPRTG